MFWAANLFFFFFFLDHTGSRRATRESEALMETSLLPRPSQTGFHPTATCSSRLCPDLKPELGDSRAAGLDRQPLAGSRPVSPAGETGVARFKATERVSGERGRAPRPRDLLSCAPRPPPPGAFQGPLPVVGFAATAPTSFLAAAFLLPFATFSTFTLII